ncbi:uncharacterized protein LOC122255346 [Penaeus japonicus]|uniref:uncharacterized protein LOC122255346 n=1 Tax=Penaeus japonicus TaxID=27405 RepID=UPI001C713ACF|nr:uncharacterized protein LOC122255346 [Penaeus japonicus]
MTVSSESRRVKGKLYLLGSLFLDFQELWEEGLRVREAEKHNLFNVIFVGFSVMGAAQNFNLKRSAVHMRRPDSQATSVKAEPGSARGSTASASGKIISSHSHAAESIRSFVEDTTILSPGCIPKDREKNHDSSQFSQSTSVQAEAESVGSPGKQDKIALDDREQCLDNNSSDMITSSTNSSREYKSTDDSMQNISEHSENSEVRLIKFSFSVSFFVSETVYTG